MSSVAPISLDRDKDDADKLADQFFEKDPVGCLPSLLSATDIVTYVERTAMINPFYATDETLKHASYETRLGDVAYTYDVKGQRQQLLPSSDGFIKIEANSIVFVESAVFFRLPRYIAARFNLQIKHVHRGLLLGTGPLVDPGFHGKLLIPLHNLTSEAYFINKDEGFIWIEFTRTTYRDDRPEPYGSYPDRKNISDGTRWLDKAAFCKHRHHSVSIRSSIPGLVETANERSEVAAQESERAANSATIAQAAANKANDQLNRIGLIAGATIFVTVLGLWAAFYFGLRSDYNTLSTRIDGILLKTEDLDDAIRSSAATQTSLENEIRELRRGISQLEADRSAGQANPLEPVGSVGDSSSNLN